ncbi:MAG: hypothetical protein ACK4F6_18160 [Hylemonella sp.]
MLSRSFAGFVDFVNCLSGGPIGANPDINQALANEKGESHELCYADRSAAYIKLEITMITGIAGLSKTLEEIVTFEIARGNAVERIDQPAGTRCPLAVIFKRPLDIKGFLSLQSLPSGVETWENRDRHYPLEAGYVCEKTRHAIAGPLA